MSLRVLVGLGNPGETYNGTRHNLGFLVIDAIASKFSFTWKLDKRFNALIGDGIIGNQKISLIKPQTFMNLSGESVYKYKEFYKVNNPEILVIYDDINLELGNYKLKISGSDGGHNGISSIILKIGADFPRFRLGIHSKYKVSPNLSEFVLGQFKSSEDEIINQLVHQWIQDVELIVYDGAEIAMNKINKKRRDNSGNKFENEKTSE